MLSVRTSFSLCLSLCHRFGRSGQGVLEVACKVARCNLRTGLNRMRQAETGENTEERKF
jgi:hypothetical protein